MLMKRLSPAHHRLPIHNQKPPSHSSMMLQAQQVDEWAKCVCKWSSTCQVFNPTVRRQTSICFSTYIRHLKKFNATRRFFSVYEKKNEIHSYKVGCQVKSFGHFFFLQVISMLGKSLRLTGPSIINPHQVIKQRLPLASQFPETSNQTKEKETVRVKNTLTMEQGSSIFIIGFIIQLLLRSPSLFYL